MLATPSSAAQAGAGAAGSGPLLLGAAGSGGMGSGWGSSSEATSGAAAAGAAASAGGGSSRAAGLGVQLLRQGSSGADSRQGSGSLWSGEGGDASAASLPVLPYHYGWDEGATTDPKELLESGVRYALAEGSSRAQAGLLEAAEPSWAGPTTLRLSANCKQLLPDTSPDVMVPCTPCFNPAAQLVRSSRSALPVCSRPAGHSRGAVLDSRGVHPRLAGVCKRSEVGPDRRRRRRCWPPAAVWEGLALERAGWGRMGARGLAKRFPPWCSPLCACRP